MYRPPILPQGNSEQLPKFCSQKSQGQNLKKKESGMPSITL